MSVLAYLGLGSNLGDRKQFLDQAVAGLGEHPGIELVEVSPYEETEPVGGPPGQVKYLNAAAKIKTDIPPLGLLQFLQEIENRLGRVRREHHGPRTIDLDLLLYGELCLKTPELEIPHPRMAERRFVLAPLAAIAPLAVHPGRQSTVADLLRELDGTRQQVRELSGKKALVTGSTIGIGRAIALELAAGGADVLVHGYRSRERAEAVTARCRAADVRSVCLLTDLSESTAALQLANETWQTWSGLDICVLNAGADTLTGPAAALSFEKKLAALWQVDVQSTIALARELGQRMKKQGHGVIVTMGWDQAETGMEGDSGQLFATVKGAVMAFTRSLALTLAPEVRVNCVAPGWIRTAWGEKASAAWQERVLRETPLGRWGTPEDVARAVRWLASPAANFVTGQILRVDGGAVRG